MFTLYSADYINAPSNCSYGDGRPVRAHHDDGAVSVQPPCRKAEGSIRWNF